jgi:hypothetical protein
MAQMLSKIDRLVEASQYDVDNLLAPYEYWPSNREQDLKVWLDGRKEEYKKRNAPPPQS